MKKEQVISIGEQSGFDKVAAQDGGFELFWDQAHLTKELMNFAKLVEQATLERAAKVCKDAAKSFAHHAVLGGPDGRNEWIAVEEAAKACAESIELLKDSHD